MPKRKGRVGVKVPVPQGRRYRRRLSANKQRGMGKKGKECADGLRGVRGYGGKKNESYKSSKSSGGGSLKNHGGRGAMRLPQVLLFRSG